MDLGAAQFLATPVGSLCPCSLPRDPGGHPSPHPSPLLRGGERVPAGRVRGGRALTGSWRGSARSLDPAGYSDTAATQPPCKKVRSARWISPNVPGLDNAQ